jgi:hypothetical protein
VTIVVGTSTPPGETEWLTGVAPDHKVNSLDSIPTHLPDVTQVIDVRPVLSQHSATVGVDLALPGDLPPCSLQPEIESTDPAE